MTDHTSVILRCLLLCFRVSELRGIRFEVTCVKQNMHELAQNISVAFLTTVVELLACAAGVNTYFTQMQRYRSEPNFITSERVLLYRSTQPALHSLKSQHRFSWVCEEDKIKLNNYL